VDTASISSPQLIQRQRQMRFNPLRSLTAATLTRALDAFLYGELREVAILWEMMADRDDTIPGVKSKREKATAHREWKVLTHDDSPEAKKQQEVLQDFWRSARAVNAYDRNETGGISRLIRQMMTAVSYKYAVHHIVWKPQPGKLSAEFEFVPLYFFENRTGQLRFIKDGIGTSGEDMPENDWMVTVGDGLMQAASIAYFFKRLSYQDWIAFSEKFGTPGILGRTNATAESDAGKAMTEAVESFGSDWSAVIFGDDASGKLELIEASASTTQPMKDIIERADRKIAALFRGADLSTMSAGSGEGSGASLQREETDILDLDDGSLITETLNRIERIVLAWHFGEDAETLAGIKLLVPVNQNLDLLLKTVVALVGLGAPFDVADVMERFGFSMPKEKATLLTPPEKPVAVNSKTAVTEKDLADALGKDTAPAREAIELLLSAKNDTELDARIRDIHARFPQILQRALDGDAATEVLTKLAAQEMLNQLAA
jgi:phage gp29-like protein